MKKHRFDLNAKLWDDQVYQEMFAVRKLWLVFDVVLDVVIRKTAK